MLLLCINASRRHRANALNDRSGCRRRADVQHIVEHVAEMTRCRPRPPSFADLFARRAHWTCSELLWASGQPRPPPDSTSRQG